VKVGYKRVSTTDQNLDRQDLPEAEKVFEEKVSGRTKARPALQAMIDFVREGDEVLVYSIDRLARSLTDLQAIVDQLNAKGVAVRFLSENLVFSRDAQDPFATLQLQLLGSFAQFEVSLSKQRQLEGIEKAKARGVYTGRKPSIDTDEVATLTAKGFTASQVAEMLGISRMSVYRALKKVSAA
jgi:DNA invertase Pin-like site-specific DNA recombinase